MTEKIICHVSKMGGLEFYCEHCKMKHYHGRKDGHRVAHCDPHGDSPYLKDGYYLVEEVEDETTL